MSDPYEIKGVTITPQGGGFYLLSHPSLAEPVKERGKEAADTRAAQIADAAADDDGASMAPQSSLLPPVAPNEPLAPPAPPAHVPGTPTSSKDDEIAALKAQLAAANNRADAAESQIVTKTVVTDGGELPPVADGKVPAAVPRKFDGQLDDKAKAELKRLGIETTEIILEENETIPPTGLFIGHNGRGYMIVPGEVVTVPNFLLNVLNDAIMSTPVVDNKTQKVLGYRNRMRYPYRKV